MSRHIAPCRAMSRHVAPCRAMSCHVAPCRAMLRHVAIVSRYGLATSRTTFTAEGPHRAMSRAVQNYIAPCRWRHVMPLSAMSRNVHFWRWRHRWRCAVMSLAMSQLVIVSFDDVAGHVAGDIARCGNEAAPCRAMVINIAARHRRPMVSHRQHRQLVPTVAFFIKSNTKKSLSTENTELRG